MGQIWGFQTFPEEPIEEMDGLELCMLMYHELLQNWVDYANSLLIILVLALFWLREIGLI